MEGMSSETTDGSDRTETRSEPTMRFSAGGLRDGFIECIPIALGVSGYGIVFGVLARQAGLTVAEAAFMSATVLAGAAQLIAITLWETPIPVIAVVGTARGSRVILGIGTVCQIGAIVFAGAAALPPGLLLVGVLGVVLGWDVGEQSINVTEQLGAGATMVRSIVVHAAATTLVGAVAMVIVYGTFLASSGGQPLVALVAFLGGGGLVLLAMRA